MGVDVDDLPTIFGCCITDDMQKFYQTIGGEGRCFWDDIESLEYRLWEHFSHVYASKYPTFAECPVVTSAGYDSSCAAYPYDLTSADIHLLLGVDLDSHNSEVVDDKTVIGAFLPADIAGMCRDFIAFNMKYAKACLNDDYDDMKPIELKMVPEEEAKELFEKSGMKVRNSACIVSLVNISA